MMKGLKLFMLNGARNMKGQFLPILAVVIICLSPIRTWAQPDDANDLRTLQDYLRYAALNNAGLQAAFEQWKIALQQIPQAKVLPDPAFTYSYFIEKVETMGGPRANKLQLMQMFPWFGTVESRTDAAAANAKAAKKRYEAEKLKLFFEVKESFFEYVYLSNAIEIARDNLDLTVHFEEVARIKYATSAATHPDIIRAQVELAKMEDDLKTLQELRAPISARLSAILNRNNANLLPWPEKQDFHKVVIDHQKLVETLKSSNPELQAFDFELEVARNKIELAQKRFYPDVSLGVEWLTNAAMDANLRDSQRDEVMLMFGLNLPIWRKSYKASELEARADLIKTQHDKKEMENTLVARAAQTLYNFEDSNRKTRLYTGVLVPKAQELVSASESAYQGGTIDFLSLIDAQQTMLGFELLGERSVADSRQRLAELEMLVGAELGSTQITEERED